MGITMTHENSQTGDLDMKSSCAPNPVLQELAQYCVDLHNTGYDTYLKVGMVIGIRLASSSSSIGLIHDGLQGFQTPSMQLGCLPSGSRSSKSVPVIRIPAGTTSYEIIKTTVEFISGYETDPMDDEPSTPYICRTELSVRV